MRLFPLTFCLIVCIAGNAQSSYQFGLLPAININKELDDAWKINLKTESRQLLKEGLFKEKRNITYQYVLTDFSIIVSKKTGLNNSLAGGYLIRIKDDKLIHRLIQQFVLTRKFINFRMAHRFSSDQSFQSNEDPEVRLRYRITFEFPLNGQSVNPNELYFKLNNEYLNAFQANQYDLEIRLVPLLGYVFTDNNKMEFGLDYRVNSLVNDPSRNRFWIAINWFIAF